LSPKRGGRFPYFFSPRRLSFWPPLRPGQGPGLPPYRVRLLFRGVRRDTEPKKQAQHFACRIGPPLRPGQGPGLPLYRVRLLYSCRYWAPACVTGIPEQPAAALVRRRVRPAKAGLPLFMRCHYCTPGVCYLYLLTALDGLPVRAPPYCAKIKSK
jgi:hypothetical protein